MVLRRRTSPADSATYEDWVAAGKPCLRQSCGHRHGEHVPSEGMECNECDCLGFVGFAHPDDSAVWSSLTRMPVTGLRRDGDKIQLDVEGASCGLCGVYMVNEPGEGMRRDEHLAATPVDRLSGTPPTGEGRTAMFNVGISLIDPPWMQA